MRIDPLSGMELPPLPEEISVSNIIRESWDELEASQFYLDELNAVKEKWEWIRAFYAVKGIKYP